MKHSRPLLIAAALILDGFLGDLPNRFHPVAWMGSLIGWAAHRAPTRGKWAPLMFGGLLVSGGVGLAAGFGFLCE